MALDQLDKAAARSILDHAHQLEATLRLAKLVEGVGVLENLAQEAENRATAAEAASKRADDHVAAVKVKADKLKDAADAHVAKVQAAADAAEARIKDAEAQAAQIIDAANASAAQIGADAKANFDAIADGLDLKLKVKAEELAAADAKVAEREADVTELDKRVERARKYLAGLAQIEA